MHRGANRRSPAVLFAAAVTVPFALSLSSSAEATASPPPDPAGAMTVFQVPTRFVADARSV
ncbi:hypothetical protein P9209_22325 [Prescottella defluvii]|nr:hypothetical protein P9209_22325 [Prescottella defluvii]